MFEKARFKFYFGHLLQYSICEVDWYGEKETMKIIKNHVAEFKGLLCEVVFKGETIYKHIYIKSTLIK